jgi:flavorubredoxin
VDDLSKLTKDIYWVGAIDWTIRNFHGYITHRGTTYNSYLIVDDKIALVDFSKIGHFDEMLRKIKQVIDPKDIDYLISNHAEPDHSGTILKMKTFAPNSEIIASERGKIALHKYYGEDIEITSIREKPELNLGNKTLKFVEVPMAHWPDSMVTYDLDEKILFSNDAFGQHLASSGRFDDEVDHDILIQEASSYYANILMPLWRSVKRAMEALKNIKIEMIAPSHGVIWRKNPSEILKLYNRWISGDTKEKAVIVYDTMWHSTEVIANALYQGLVDEGVETVIHSLNSSHRSDVITDILDAKAVFVGSPTLNNHVFPTVAGFIAYLRGLKPQNKIGAVFGSYGWGGGAKKWLESEMKATGIELLESDLEYVLRPTEKEYEKTKEYGRRIAKKIKES